MKIRTVFLLLTVILSLFCASPAFSQTPEPYKPEEFPGFLHDVRRAEIITLGAMPFVTFNVSLGFSFGKFAAHNFDTDYFVNPFASSSDSSYSTDEQVGIILTSLGISFGIGLTDFIIHSIKRSSRARQIKNQKNTAVIITPIREDPDAVRLPDSEKSSESEAFEEFETEIQQDD